MLGGIILNKQSISQRALNKIMENHEAESRVPLAIPGPLLRSITSRTGRKKKSTVNRSAKGKSRGEGISEESLAVRDRELRAAGVALHTTKSEGGRPVLKRTATDRLSGTTLGILYLRYQGGERGHGAIDRDQFEAGEKWAEIIHNHASIMGYKLSTKSPSTVMVGGGGGNGADPSPETIKYVRNQFAVAYNAIVAECKTHGLEIRDVTYKVCVENYPHHGLSEVDYGALRVGLNALVRVLR